MADSTDGIQVEDIALIKVKAKDFHRSFATPSHYGNRKSFLVMQAILNFLIVFINQLKMMFDPLSCTKEIWFSILVGAIDYVLLYPNIKLKNLSLMIVSSCP